MTESTAPTATPAQIAALNWLNTREGTRPSTTVLRALAAKGFTTAPTANAAELTDTGRAALGIAPVLAPVPSTPAPAAPQGDTAPVAEAPAKALADSQGTALAVGDRVTISAKGNNVRKQDVGATGTITGTTRGGGRLLVAWDGPAEAAPRWPVLPGLVTRQA